MIISTTMWQVWESQRQRSTKKRAQRGGGPFRETSGVAVQSSTMQTLMRFLVLGLILLVILMGGVPPQQADAADREINVAAAADLSAALQEVAAIYQKHTGAVVKLSFGASGALTQQIQNGAPFDIFFSADMEYPRQLIAAGQAESATLYRYAVGRLVLWVPADSPLDVEHKGIDVLLDPAVKKISMANPQHAPYGRAAEAALKHYGLYEKVG